MRIVRLRKGDTLVLEGIWLAILGNSVIGVPKGCKVFREDGVTWIVRAPKELDRQTEPVDTLP